MLTFLATLDGELFPKSLQVLLQLSAFKLFSVETITYNFNLGYVKHVPFLEDIFGNDDANTFLGTEYLLLKQATADHIIQMTQLDETSAAAEIIFSNNYKSNYTSDIFTIGEALTQKFAYLYTQHTQEFLDVIRIIFPKLVASGSVKIPGFSSKNRMVSP